MNSVRVLWSYVDAAEDKASLTFWPDGTESFVQLDALSVRLTASAVRGLRDALNRLLAGADDDEQNSHSQTTDGAQALQAAQQQLQARVRRIAEQLNEHTTELAEVAGRAAWVGDRPLRLSGVAEVVYLLAVQQQRVAASLGDLLSAIAGES